ncbi:hypothetical protein CEXT_8061 [Caerostris extrusa]|uniref:Uncharacterized protein n=1 Tax=Caerostris extrusa TaxID=172846 RepID=A0AAV4PU18_CAEEX|nr:hypothetical protein CEXT_8061 [Caerostris extrusa]
MTDSTKPGMPVSTVTTQSTALKERAGGTAAARCLGCTWNDRDSSTTPYPSLGYLQFSPLPNFVAPRGDQHVKR